MLLSMWSSCLARPPDTHSWTGATGSAITVVRGRWVVEVRRFSPFGEGRIAGALPFSELFLKVLGFVRLAYGRLRLVGFFVFLISYWILSAFIFK